MPASFLGFLAHGLLQTGWGGLALYLLVATQLTIFSVTLYLHRSMAHRGVDFHPVVAHVFRFWTWLTTSMVTREWVAIHRKHHAKCETEEDPHSPMQKGIKTVFWRGVELYREARAQRDDMEKYGKGCPDDWIERHVYTPHATMGPTLLLFISFALFGFAGVAVWAIQMLWIPFWAAGVVNGIGHWWGYRNFETADTATNLTPWAFWIGGEELHNNHHAFPSSSKFALRKFELDIGWVAIRGFELLGLAKVLRVAPKLDVRPNIAVPDTETMRAMMAHRWQVATDYFSTVLKPQLRQDARDMPRRLRNALRSEGRWLDATRREKMRGWLAERPRLLTLMEYRQRLLAIYELKSAEVDTKLDALRAWCAEAEASGNAALAQFSMRLKGYALVPTRG